MQSSRLHSAAASGALGRIKNIARVTRIRRIAPLTRIPAARVTGRSILLAAVCLAMTLSLGAESVAANADRDALVAGVSQIDAPGAPGPLCVYGPNAFPVVVGPSGDAFEPVVAAGRVGQGRVVVLGHDGYFAYRSLMFGDTGQLVINAVRWAAGGRSSPTVAVFNQPHVSDYLAGSGFMVEDIHFTGALTGQHVAVIGPSTEDDARIAMIRDFVQSGGGLVIAATGWGWAQLNPALDLRSDFTGNRLLADAGIQFSDAWLQQGSSGYETGTPPELTHAQAALDAATESESGQRQLSDTEMAQVTVTLQRAAQCAAAGDPFRTRLGDALGSEYVVPSPEDPVYRSEIFDRVAVAQQSVDLDELPPDEVPSHPASALFPGIVPADAVMTATVLPIDPGVPRWQSTGLYARPGEPVTLTVPESAVGMKLQLRVGTHTDTLWHLDEWRRMPAIAKRIAVTSRSTRLASPYGGLVYVEVPEGLEPPHAPFTVTVAGAVEAPYFIRDETDLAVWQSRIRSLPAPWAELQGRNIVVTVPSELVRELDDPQSLLETWDRALDLSAHLAAWPEARVSPERIVPDEQISAGYVHAGYPLMTHLDQASNMVDRQHLLEGNWGFFHEIGHNHQSPDWTFSGTGEVTVNLFTLYVFEHLCGVPPAMHERGSEAFVLEQMAKYDFDNPDFAQWQSDPFLALAMYVQLQHAFGWDTYRTVFADYLSLPDDARPTTNAEKRDEWLVRFSRATRRNLAPFFHAWGVPTSAEARELIAHYPEWMPDGFPDTYNAPLTPTEQPPTPTATVVSTVTPRATSTPTDAPMRWTALIPWASVP